jgi:hypothetical protein
VPKRQKGSTARKRTERLLHARPPRRPSLPSAPAPAAARRTPPPPASGADVDPPPPTKPESGVIPTTARAQLEDLATSIRKLVEEVRSDETSTFSEKASVLRTAMAHVKLLGHLTGELGATESTVIASPHFKRVLAEIIDALKPYPEAARAVATRLRSTEAAA